MIIATIASLTSCSIEGTPIGGRGTPSTACERLEVPAPAPGHVKPHPGPGQAQMTISVEIRAGGYSLDRNGQFTKLDREWCIPFDYTVTASVMPLDSPATITLSDGTVRRLPASGSARTPWAADAILTWGADDDPPLVSLGIEATYAVDRDFADYRAHDNSEDPRDDEARYSRIAFRCAIFVNGGPHPIVQDMREDARSLGQRFVRCDLGPNGPIKAIPF